MQNGEDDEELTNNSDVFRVSVRISVNLALCSRTNLRNISHNSSSSPSGGKSRLQWEVGTNAEKLVSIRLILVCSVDERLQWMNPSRESGYERCSTLVSPDIYIPVRRLILEALVVATALRQAGCKKKHSTHVGTRTNSLGGQAADTKYLNYHSSSRKPV